MMTTILMIGLFVVLFIGFMALFTTLIEKFKILKNKSVIYFLCLIVSSIVLPLIITLAVHSIFFK